MPYRVHGVKLAVAGALLILGAIGPAHFWREGHRTIGLLSEHACIAARDCATTRLDRRFEGFWPRLGTITFVASMAAVACLLVAALLAQWRARVPALGYLAAFATVVTAVCATIFFLERPAELAHVDFDLGYPLTMLGALCGGLGAASLTERSVQRG